MPALILCVFGWSGSGKTTLIESLIAELVSRGLRVGALKSAPHADGILPEGKDSTRFHRAGADTALMTDEGFHADLKGPGVFSRAVADRLFPEADIVIAENADIPEAPGGAVLRLLVTGSAKGDAVPKRRLDEMDMIVRGHTDPCLRGSKGATQAGKAIFRFDERAGLIDILERKALALRKGAPLPARLSSALMGLVLGDALGVPAEFMDRSELAMNPVLGMRGGGKWGQLPGTWSDDGSLALCLAQSIAESGFSPRKAGELALSWLDSGRWSARGEVFDVGAGTRRALERFRAGTPALLSGGTAEEEQGNGSLMRILPVALWLQSSPAILRRHAVEAYSSLTHRHPLCLAACRAYAEAIAALARGGSAKRAVAAAAEELRLAAREHPSEISIQALGKRLSLLAGGWEPDGLRGSGWVADSLEAACWAFLRGEGLQGREEAFRTALLAAVNLGDDADTTAAIAGGLAGMAAGDALPGSWLADLARSGDAFDLARQLSSLATREAPFPDAYWVLPGKFLAGGNPQARARGPQRMAALLAAGVDMAIDLCEPGEFPEDGAKAWARACGLAGQPAIECRNFPIEDMDIPEGSDLEEILASIREGLASGRTVYVHCHAGRGRTGTIVASYLVTEGLARGEESLDLVRELRAGTDQPLAPSPETEEQRAFALSLGLSLGARP